jgi:hypothetical protein
MHSNRSENILQHFLAFVGSLLLLSIYLSYRQVMRSRDVYPSSIDLIPMLNKLRMGERKLTILGASRCKTKQDSEIVECGQEA